MFNVLCTAFLICTHVPHHPCLCLQEESAPGLCSAYIPAMGLCQKAVVLRLHQPATCPAIWTHVTSARRMSAPGEAHAWGRAVSVTPATAVHTVRCNAAASLLAACLCAARLLCMHPVTSAQQLRGPSHTFCVCVCVCARACAEYVAARQAAMSSIKHPSRMPSSLLTPHYSCIHGLMSFTITVPLHTSL